MKERRQIFAQVLAIFSALFSLLALASCFAERDSSAKYSAGAASVQSPKFGVNIEAKYDVRLDNLIPGYKIVTVGLTNNGVESIRLNPLKDKWEITDAYGKNRRAINSIRIKDPSLWGRLPANLKRLLEYPIAVSMGYTETIDLFFPAEVDLSSFRAISFYSAELDQKFDGLSQIEDERAVPINSLPSDTIQNQGNVRPKKKTRQN